MSGTPVRAVAPSLESRLRRLADDLSVVSAYLLLPEDLEDRLPEVDRTFAGFRQGGRDTGAGGGGHPVAGLENRPGSSPSSWRVSTGGSASRSSTSCISLFPTSPGSTCPRESPTTSRGRSAGSLKRALGQTVVAAAQGYQRYLLQLGYVDSMLGRLMRRMRAEKLYDRSMIVVTADHGISFRSDVSRRVVGPENVGDIANVPLFVKLPGQQSGHLDAAPVTTDILPTVADTVGVRLAGDMNGGGRSMWLQCAI